MRPTYNTSSQGRQSDGGASIMLRTPMITYHQLRTFLAVARAGNLTRAARELSSSQPTVSLQLRALRKSLGAPLFEGHGSEFRLTPAGEKLRRYAEDALAGLSLLQQELEALKGSVAGPLHVGATFSVSRYLLPSALYRFREQFSDVQLQLHVDVPPEHLFDGLLANSLDVACYVRVRTPPELTVESLCGEELAVVASPQHPLAGRRRVPPEDLSAHPFVASAVMLFREVVENRLSEAGVKPMVVAEGPHHDAVKKLVERRVGYSVLIKSSVADELARGRLVALKLDAPPFLTDVVIAYRSRPVISPLVREFIEFVRAELAQPRRRAASSGANRRQASGR